MVIEFLRAAGVNGVILTILFFWSLFLFGRNFIFLWLVNRDFKPVFRDIKWGDVDVKTVKNPRNNPLLGIILSMARFHVDHSDDIRSEVDYLFYKNFHRVNKSLMILRLISVIAPLLGLMGTMLGMVSMFRGLATEAGADSTVIAGGIMEALLTSIMGLCVAIPTLCFYYFLGLKVKGLRIEAVEYATRIVATLNPDCPYVANCSGLIEGERDA